MNLLRACRILDRLDALIELLEKLLHELRKHRPRKVQITFGTPVPLSAFANAKDKAMTATVTQHLSQKVLATATFSDGSIPADTAFTASGVGPDGTSPIVTLLTTNPDGTPVAQNQVWVASNSVGTASLTVIGGGVTDTATVTVQADLNVAISFGTPVSK